MNTNQSEDSATKPSLTVFLDLGFFLILSFLVKSAAFNITSISGEIFPYFAKAFKSSDTWTEVLKDFRLWLIIAAVIIYSVIKQRPGASILNQAAHILSSPICTSTLHFAIFLIGIYFSIISSAVHTWITTESILTYRESFSYSLALLFITITVFILNQLAINKKNSDIQDTQVEAYNYRITQLQELIRLAPPNGFAKTLAEYVDVADDFVQMVGSGRKEITSSLNYLKAEAPDKLDFHWNPTKGIVDLKANLNPQKVNEERANIKKHIQSLNDRSAENAKYIRALLAAYARLAALFDGVEPSRTNNNIYRANLMLKYSSIDKTLPELKEFRYIPAVLKHQDSSGNENLKANSLGNYLTLHQELSVEIYTDKKSITKKVENSQSNTNEYEPIKFEPDSEIDDFSIPYFEMTSQKKYNCFGAPRAIAEAECQFINDTMKAIEHWKKESSPPDELVEEAKVHFSRHNRAKSIISLPLMTSRYSEEHKKNVMGVVNIYRDKTNLMMGDQSKQKQFEHITTPLNFALARIVSQDIIVRYNAIFLQEILDSVTISGLECAILDDEENKGVSHG
ncbi:hypothetical protein [Vibrio alginolyticus]|uniref:hypothetical protein n=1 Tax=Vibrio alginolyticus TaxID=663 RepID=UPI001110982F|nr:hypothetical protein [Vibrio alginolyticus]TMX49923.1 hypothetical protein DA091_20285 [Vibrio alginolyticus]CAH0527627.1 hypothetical protein CTH30272_01271 [Catenococcus thiocycli]